MTAQTSVQPATMTVRIPMRLERRGGRKVIVAPEAVLLVAAAEARRAADPGDRQGAPLASPDRERQGEVDHRPRGTGGRVRRLCIPGADPDVPGAGNRRGRSSTARSRQGSPRCRSFRGRRHGASSAPGCWASTGPSQGLQQRPVGS